MADILIHVPDEYDGGILCMFLNDILMDYFNGTFTAAIVETDKQEDRSNAE